jgi:hypothetical protein
MSTEEIENPVDSKGPRVRWLLCIAVIVTVVATTFISSQGNHLQACPDGVGRPCRSLQFGDAPVIVALILAAALLLPDLRRLSIGGLVELERTVRETQVEVSDARREIAALSVAVSTKAHASSELRIDQYVMPFESLQDEDLETLKARARQARVIK